jgi:SAM-dependent methyltransferase
MKSKNTVTELRELYSNGGNIMEYLRKQGESEHDQASIIELSYDLQAGSYVDLLKRPDVMAKKLQFSKALARYIDELEVSSLLEAGVGEATTLAHVLQLMDNPPKEVYGFDIAWSRLKFAEKYIRGQELGIKVDLFTSDLTSIAAPDNAYELVLTCHAVEPNRGDEEEIIRELSRVSNKYVLMLEPASMLGSDETKAHIEKNRYCKDLRLTAERVGLRVVDHSLFEHCANTYNQTELLLLEVPAEEPKFEHKYGCPVCSSLLEHKKGSYYCYKDALVFPVIDGIPCLRRGNGIIATKFLDFYNE